jgi:uncharacterized protein YrrD
MDHNHMSLDLRGKKIVSVTNGEIIGEVVDVLVDPEQRYVAALVTSKGNLFRRETQMLARDDITVIGKHVILSTRPDVVRNSEDFSTSEKWVAVSDHLRGNDVVTNDGTRVGRLQDIIIDAQGQIVGYSLSNVSVSGPIADTKQIPASSVMSFGKDVVIVDPAVIHTREQPLRTESDRTDIFGRDRTEEGFDETPMTDDVDREKPVNYHEEPVEDFQRSEDYNRSQQDVHGAQDYPRTTDQDYPHKPVDEFGEEPVEDYPQTRDYQKPRIASDEEERRRDDF